MRIVKTTDFENWFSNLNSKIAAQVEARLYRIVEMGHFGDAKGLGDGLAELRWSNGRRVYFAIISDKCGKYLLLILGGLKNAQKKDIKKAKLLLKRFSDH